MTDERDKDRPEEDRHDRGGHDQDQGHPDRDEDRGAVTHFAAAGRGRPCPICGKPAKTETRPFCSKRCADIDLGRWLGESYRIPAIEPPEGADLEHGGTDGGPDGSENGRNSRG